MKKAVRRPAQQQHPVFSSKGYWTLRYRNGLDSGYGSGGHYAQLKAQVLNDFVNAHNVQSVIEFGCGDGAQLALSQYPKYLGLDVSDIAIAKCRKFFAKDKTKQFKLIDKYSGETAELSLSIDVLYHLTESGVFERHLRHVFGAGTHYVILFSTDFEEPQTTVHILHRKFTPWVEQNIVGWKLIETIKNEKPGASRAQFFYYERSHNGV